MVGIENLKIGMLSLITFGVELEKALEDGKLSLLEAFNLLPEAKDVYDAFKRWEDLVLEYNDLDNTEREVLKNFWAQELDLKNDSLEIVIEMAFNWVVSTDAFRAAIREAKNTSG